MYLEEICDDLLNLCMASGDFTETANGLTIRSDYISDITKQLLLNLSVSLIKAGATSAIAVEIDSLQIDWESIEEDITTSSDWRLYISNKVELLVSLGIHSSDFKELLFIDSNYFSDSWLPEQSGIKTPERSEIFAQDKPVKIRVHRYEREFGGPKVIIINTKKNDTSTISDWLESTKLPTSNDLDKTIHFVSSRVNGTSPEKYYITWGTLDSKEATLFFNACATLLLLSLCQEYYSNSKIILNGTKRIETPLYIGNESDISRQEFNVLKEAVEWCYAESNSDKLTKILLIIDRISLDLDRGSSLLSSIAILDHALKEAKSKYKYVIKDRNKDYVKELSDLQKDLSSLIEKITEQTISFSRSFLRDLLTAGFLLTAGVVSRKIVDDKILASPEAEILFKAFGSYLLLSLFINFFHGCSALSLTESLFYSWKKILSSHIPIEELKRKISKSITPVKCRFWATYIVIGILYLILALLCFSSSWILKLAGVIST